MSARCNRPLTALEAEPVPALEPMNIIHAAVCCDDVPCACLPDGVCCCLPLRPLAAIEDATTDTLLTQFNALLAAMRSAGWMDE